MTGAVFVITERAGQVLDMQVVDEDLVPAILEHIEQHHAHDGLRVTIRSTLEQV